MKFFTIMYNDESWNTSAMALNLGMKLRRSGHYGGWLTREELDKLEKGGFRYTIKY